MRIFIFFIFVIMVYKIFGATDENIKNVVTHYSALHWTIAIIAIIVALGALSTVFGQKALTSPGTGVYNESAAAIEGGTATGDYNQNLWTTLFHPKIAGTIFVLLVATMALALLTGKARPPWPPDSFYH